MNHNYKLLTPGPLTTTDSVKREMAACLASVFDADLEPAEAGVLAGVVE